MAEALVIAPLAPAVEAAVQLGVEGYPLAQLLQRRGGGELGEVELRQVLLQVGADEEGTVGYGILIFHVDNVLGLMKL